MSEPAEFNQGGIVKGDITVYAKFVDYPAWRRWASPPENWLSTHTGSPIYPGGVIVIYADECVISRNKVCIRRDEIHQKFVPRDYDEQGHKRFWHCPMHDEEAK